MARPPLTRSRVHPFEHVTPVATVDRDGATLPAALRWYLRDPDDQDAVERVVLEVRGDASNLVQLLEGALLELRAEADARVDEMSAELDRLRGQYRPDPEAPLTIDRDEA